MICRNCQRVNHEEAVFCAYCGASIATLCETKTDEKTKITFDESCSLEVVDEKKKKTWKKTTIFAICLIFLIILFIPCLILNLISAEKKLKKQDISVINGCPEFYNLEWNMSIYEASYNIEIEHKTHSFGITINEPFFLDGIETEVFLSFEQPSFEKSRLSKVIFVFNNNDDDEVADKLLELYTKIYGEPSQEHFWEGERTTITIIEKLNEKQVLVVYEANRYPMLSLDGPEEDPFGLTDKNSIFGENVLTFLKGITLDEDYTIYEDDYFTSYTLYPKFEYMGIEKGLTAIELYVGSNDNIVNLISYLFAIETQDTNTLLSQTSYMKSRLAAIFGESRSCTYTSLLLDGSGIKDITFQEMLSMLENKREGIFHVQWNGKNGGYVTFALTVDYSEQYLKGSVSFAQ